MFKRGGSQTIMVHTDVDGSMNDNRSASGYSAFLCRNLVAWRRKRKSVVARPRGLLHAIVFFYAGTLLLREVRSKAYYLD